MNQLYPQGGVIPRSNASYPMADLQGASAYAAPLNFNKPTEVISGYDAKINPMTGQEIPQTNFARGGNVKPEAGLASLVASRGRGGDSMLVHMAPEEVQGLQALAMAHGGSLSINPETGLVEANFLKKLLPTLIGFGLNFVFPGLGALGSSLLVGGVEAARTGDLSKGLMAGLGAYGGASLGSAVSTAGATAGSAAKTALQTGADATAQGIQAVAPGATTTASNVGALTGSEAIRAAGAAGTDTITKALAPEAFKNVAAADITKANLSAGLEALKTAPGATLKAVGSRLGPAGVAGLGTTASSLMTPEFKPYDPEDPSYYISGGYDPERGFLPGYYTKKYPGMAAGGGVSALKYGQGGAARNREDMSREDYAMPRNFVTPEYARAGGAYGMQSLAGRAPRSQPVNQAPVAPTAPASAPAPEAAGLPFASAANVQYGGSGAEQLSAYMQNLNKSLVAPPQAPKPAAPAPAGYVPGAAPTADAYRGILSGVDLNELRNFGINIDPSRFATAAQPAQSQYSKPIYRMTSDEVAAEDAARKAAEEAAARQAAQTAATAPPAANPFAGTGIDFSGINFSGIGGAGSYNPPAYQPPAEPTYQPPVEPTYQPPQEPIYQQEPFAYVPGAADVLPEKNILPDYIAPEPVAQPRFDMPVEDRTPFYAPSEPVQEFVDTPYMPIPEFDYTRRKPSYVEPVEQYEPQPIPSMRYEDLIMRPQFENYREPVYAQPEAPYMPTYEYEPPADRDFVFDSGNAAFYAAGGVAGMNQGLGAFDQNYDRNGNEFNFGFAKGGVPKRRRKRKQKPVAGKLVSGNGDGMSDSIKANINGDQEARLTDGEFVIPADVVSHLGNGSTDAGSKKLYDMMARVRKARTGRSRQAPQVNVDEMMP